MQRILVYLVLSALLVPMKVLASSQASIVEGYIPVSSGGKETLIFKLKDNVVEGCNSTGRFAISEDNLRYRATFSAVVAAFHAQTPVEVKYFSSCNAWSNSADVNFVCIGDINC